MLYQYKSFNPLVDKKKNYWKKWRAEEEERHKGSLTKKNLLACCRVVPGARKGLRSAIASENGRKKCIEEISSGVVQYCLTQKRDKSRSKKMR
jgi:hypothetical protein